MNSWNATSSSSSECENQGDNIREHTKTVGPTINTDMDWEDLNDAKTIATARSLGMTGKVETFRLEENGSSRSLYSSACESQEEPDLAERPKFDNETKRVRQWRRLALFLIFAAGAGVSYMTYTFLSSEETDNEEEAFEQFTSSIVDVTNFRVQNMFDGLRGFSEMITAHATRNNETWPLVTLPNFEVIAEHIRVQTKVEFINFVPLVDLEDRLEFEQYAFENQWWIDESRKFTLGKEGTLKETNEYLDMEIDGVIKARCEDGLCPSPNVTDRVYAPVWQVSPPPFTPLLICSDGNNRNDLWRELEAIEETRDTVTSRVFRTKFLTGSSISQDAHEEFHSRFVSPNIGNTTGDDRPHFIVTTPVFEGLGDRFSPVVGLILSVVTLDAYVGNLLPSSVEPIDLVVENSCNQSYSYRIDGDISIYLGSEDLHDPKVEDRRVEVNFNAFLDPETSMARAPCTYTFAMYPTEQFQQSYGTPLPAVFTIVVASIFLLLASVFFVYDYMVGSEQLTAALRNEMTSDSQTGSSSKNRRIGEEQSQHSKR